MTTMDEVRTFVGKEANLTELDELKGLIERAKKYQASRIPVGTRARITDVRPKYLAGLTGEVVGFENGKVLFKPDVPQPRFGMIMRMHPGTVIPL